MDRLVALALGVSVMSMFLSCAAIWPHSQAGMQRTRNAFLWAIFSFVFVGAATVGYRKLDALRRPTAGQSIPTEFANYQREPREIAPSLQFAPAHDRLDLRPHRGIAGVPESVGSPGERVYNASYRQD